MKGFVYAYVIGTSHTKEKVNVFNVKNLIGIIHYNGIQSRDELVLSCTFCNIMH
jgi:hypothetical protein